MAKSIWKRGERITRLEKKQLRKRCPHPNRGRALYQWRAENARISGILGNLDAREVNWTDIKAVPELFAPGEIS